MKKISHNPSVGVTLPKKVKSEFRALTIEETRAFLAVIADDPLNALFHVLVCAGLRPSEAFALKWSDLDLDGVSALARNSIKSSFATDRDKANWLTDRT